MKDKIEICKEKLILVEGKDAYHFFIHACENFNPKHNIQIINFGGVKELEKFLNVLKLLPGYEKVNKIAIIRDAEKDAESAIQSIKKSLKSANLSVPCSAFKFYGGSPQIAFMILPGFKENNCKGSYFTPGSLEDLCLKIAKDESTLLCVEEYIKCLKKNNYIKENEKIHKIKLHTYLSGKDKFVGLKIGEASKAGAWDWNHHELEKFKAIILSM